MSVHELQVMTKPDFMLLPPSVQRFHQAKMYIATEAKRIRAEAVVIPGLTAPLQRSVVQAQMPMSSPQLS